MTTKNIDSNEPHHVKKESKFDVRKVYLKFMNLFIRDDKKAKRNRKRILNFEKWKPLKRI